MAPAVRIFRKFRAADGRIKIATLSGVSGLVIALALLMGVFPAFAEHELENGPEVPPIKIEYGGGSGACDATFTGLPSAAEHELWINNPMTGTFRGPDGTDISIIKDGNFFDFVAPPGIGVFDVIVNGGSHNNHYDYDDRGDGPVTHDDGLHAPRKGGQNSPPHNLSHINLCYEELPPGSVSGVKYHDRDADGTKDASGEDVLPGWTITAFPVSVDETDGTTVDTANGQTATTGSDGFYSLSLIPGNYVVCEAAPLQSGLSPDDPSVLPPNGDGYTWSWGQSQPSGQDPGVCAGISGYEALGYAITVDGDMTGLDFGNHWQVSVICDADGVVVPLSGGTDEPSASVTFPAGCQSGVGENDPYTTSFDLGLSDDGDVWTQFVVFGGDVNGSSIILDQTIEWAPEMLDPNRVDPPFYNAENQLVVSTTKVLLDLTGDIPDDLVDVTFCHDLPEDAENPDDPALTQDIPQCLDSRTIAEGGDVPADHIQVTEHYKVLGDPGNFR